MRTYAFLAVLSLSVALACSSGTRFYDANVLVPVPAGPADSLQDLVFTRVQVLGFKVLTADAAVARLAELEIGVRPTSDFLYAERQRGCGLNCKQVDALIISFAPGNDPLSEWLVVWGLTCQRGWISPWRLKHPSEGVRHAADSLAQAFRG